MKYVCSICGYTAEGECPEKCPLCGASKEKFNAIASTGTAEAKTATGDKKVFADGHVVGVAKGVDEEVLKGLKEHFMGECTEVGMYLAMSRQADREGFPEIAEAYKRIAFEEAEHAAKFGELLGEVVTSSTAKNLQMRVDAEQGACQSKLDIAKKAKQLGYDAIHDTVHEMAKDEARHGQAFEGLLKRYFN